ncbi:MAG: type I phosphomannose isomerase catalytic subunit [Eubacteriales bacterium]|jgi:mannose-6-phosphate isomerase
MKLYPLKLAGIPHNMLWGGSRLRDIYKKPGATDKTGETWELTVRPADVNRIENGAYAGRTLGDFISEAGQRVVSDSYDGGRFPLLVKFIDTADDLSIQVHPDNEYAARVEKDSGKTEMWYVIDAQPGAEIIYGLREGCTKEDLKRALEAGEPRMALNYVRVSPGDCFFIPAGLVHAIGRGIFIAEIQQNCDLTYRVYDYGRIDLSGKPRDLHTKKAFDVIRPYTREEIEKLRMSAHTSEQRDSSLLAHCEYFKTIKLDIRQPVDLFAGSVSFNSLLCITGSGRITCNSEEYKVKAGDSWLIPAGTGHYRLSGELRVLLTTLK